jgi:molybdenum transport protein
MFYISDALLDQLLLDDIQHGDLTSRALGIARRNGEMTFKRKSAGRVSGISVAERLLIKLNLQVEAQCRDGDDVDAGQTLLIAKGSADKLHQGWKVVQNVLEWSCGVAQYMAEMVAQARSVNGKVHIACTRKSIPGTKFLAIPSVIDGGGILHRGGTAETILLFANHRRFFPQPDNWQQQVERLRLEAPEKKIIVEADTVDEALLALKAKPDIVQLDKFALEDIQCVVQQGQKTVPDCLISLAGGISKENVRQYASTGVSLLVTSSPYYAQPTDIKVTLYPIDECVN